MENKTNISLWLFATVIVIAFISLVAYFNSTTIQQTQNRRVGELFALSYCSLPKFSAGVLTNAGVEADNQASTSLSFLGTGDTASTTLGTTANPCSISRANSVDLNMFSVASSTATVWLWEIDFSPNNIDWYCEDGKSVDTKIATSHGSQCMTHSWNPSTTATTSKNVTITPVASQYIRVQFKATAANGELWAELVKKDLAN